MNMEDILRNFYIEFCRTVDGIKLCRELESKSLVINDDTELVIASSGQSKIHGNGKLYDIICRKIIHLKDLLSAIASIGHHDLARKIYDDKREHLPPSFFLPHKDNEEVNTGTLIPEQNITVNASSVSISLRDHNVLSIHPPNHNIPYVEEGEEGESCVIEEGSLPY